MVAAVFGVASSIWIWPRWRRSDAADPESRRVAGLSGEPVVVFRVVCLDCAQAGRRLSTRLRGESRLHVEATEPPTLINS